MLKKNQVLKLKVNRTSLDHYVEKGYEVKVNQTIMVAAEDLSHGSDKKVQVICDYCSQEFEKQFKRFIAQREHVQKDACKKCFSLKQKEVVQAKYNVDSTLQLEENQIKSKATLYANYGVDNPMKNTEIKERMFDTIEERYGKRFAQQNKKIRAKTILTLQKNYGVDHISKSPEGKKRYISSLKHVNGVRVSKGQIVLAEALQGDLNVMISGYYADIIFNNKVIIEYDGSGHKLSVIMGKQTLEAFEQKETLREQAFESKGWTVIRVENLKDKQFSITDIEAINELVKNGKKAIYKMQ